MKSTLRVFIMNDSFHCYLFQPKLCYRYKLPSAKYRCFFHNAGKNMPQQTNINIFLVDHKFKEESTRFIYIFYIVYLIFQILYYSGFFCITYCITLQKVINKWSELFLILVISAINYVQNKNIFYTKYVRAVSKRQLLYYMQIPHFGYISQLEIMIIISIIIQNSRINTSSFSVMLTTILLF